MLPRDVLPLIEDLAIDDPPDPSTLPEFKTQFGHDLRDDELGLRSLLEQPEMLSRSWWQPAHTSRRRRPSSKALKRHATALRAA